jgi:hypothetical protein
MLDWANLNRPGIIDEDIDSAKMIQNRLYHGIDLILTGNIAWHRKYRSGALAQVVMSAFQL